VDILKRAFRFQNGRSVLKVFISLMIKLSFKSISYSAKEEAEKSFFSLAFLWSGLQELLRPVHIPFPYRHQHIET